MIFQISKEKLKEMQFVMLLVVLLSSFDLDLNNLTTIEGCNAICQTNWDWC